jgi:chromosome segregation ATPase
VQRPHRRFVRDGEVPVEVVHHEGAGSNQLEAARQAVRTLTTAREQAERQLAEAQATIRDLQTKLAHERMARDEAVQRAAVEGDDTEKALQLARADLDAERAARRATEERLAAALQRCAAAERRAEELTQPALALETAELDAERENVEAPARTEKPARRRGRPPKAKAPEPDPEFVEWWKPGWQEQFR